MAPMTPSTAAMEDDVLPFAVLELEEYCHWHHREEERDRPQTQHDACFKHGYGGVQNVHLPQDILLKLAEPHSCTEAFGHQLQKARSPSCLRLSSVAPFPPRGAGHSNDRQEKAHVCSNGVYQWPGPANLVKSISCACCRLSSFDVRETLYLRRSAARVTGWFCNICNVLPARVTAVRPVDMRTSVVLAVTLSTSPCLGEDPQPSSPRYTTMHYFLMGLSVLLFAALVAGVVLLLREEMLRRRRAPWSERRTIINVRPRTEKTPGVHRNGSVAMEDISVDGGTRSPPALEPGDR
ncbi:uncharacterized protein LOC112561424 [Pomacea canaliculata]|uniref:uncharacterized protein LOC112561424 n=1 Tax=Pomacea canaliculata TaxID=400727 RepID=UPI000D739E1B|nr:uncharacterized protein LOC112561424 [Pomacea canaliculata]